MRTNQPSSLIDFHSFALKMKQIISITVLGISMFNKQLEFIRKKSFPNLPMDASEPGNSPTVNVSPLLPVNERKTVRQESNHG